MISVLSSAKRPLICYRVGKAALPCSRNKLTIRNRVLDNLETSENRRREVERRIPPLNAQVESYQQQQEVLLNAF